MSVAIKYNLEVCVPLSNRTHNASLFTGLPRTQSVVWPIDSLLMQFPQDIDIFFWKRFVCMPRKIIFRHRAFQTALQRTHLKKAIFGAACSLFFLLHNLVSLLPVVFHNELKLLSLLGLFYLSMLVPWKTHIYQREGVNTFDLCEGTKERPEGSLIMQGDWPSTGGVNKERDQCGGGGAHTVESQHGVLELLLTDNMIWNEKKKIHFLVYLV